jgi:hypothetical protein
MWLPRKRLRIVRRRDNNSCNGADDESYATKPSFLVDKRPDEYFLFRVFVG